MKLNFCTLFNSAYLSRGMVLYHSLVKYCPDFHLYIFAFDDKCYDYLVSQKLEHVSVVSLKEFEDPELLKVKPTRSSAEYCWTCTASTILFSIQQFGLKNCTYIDADMEFYNDPGILIREMGDNSVLITKHNYTEEYDQSEVSGKYCVQFVTFLNDENGMAVLNWWRNACIEWCYARVEDGKYGDQKYLDEWTTRFKGVHVLEHPGGGIAPWNVQQYHFFQKGTELQGRVKATGKTFPAVFFHFHGLKFFTDGIVMYTGDLYHIGDDVKELFFKPYVRQLLREKSRIEKADPSFDPNGAKGKAPMEQISLGFLVRYYLYDLKHSFRNIFGKHLRWRIRHHYYYRTEDFNS